MKMPRGRVVIPQVLAGLKSMIADFTVVLLRLEVLGCKSLFCCSGALGELLLVVLAKTNRDTTSGKSSFEKSDSRRSRQLKDVRETRGKDRQSCRQELFEEVCLGGQTEGDYPWWGKEHAQLLLRLTNLQAGADQGSNINRKHLLTSSLESDIVRNELDVVLHLHAWVSRLLQDGISLAPRMDLGSDIRCWSMNGAVCQAHYHI